MFEKLFLARTKTIGIFKEANLQKKDKARNKFKTLSRHTMSRKDSITNIESYYPIKLFVKQKVTLFIMQKMNMFSKLLFLK